jgi:hypothetical protein
MSLRHSILDRRIIRFGVILRSGAYLSALIVAHVRRGWSDAVLRARYCDCTIRRL